MGALGADINFLYLVELQEGQTISSTISTLLWYTSYVEPQDEHLYSYMGMP